MDDLGTVARLLREMQAATKGLSAEAEVVKKSTEILALARRYIPPDGDYEVVPTRDGLRLARRIDLV